MSLRNLQTLILEQGSRLIRADVADIERVQRNGRLPWTRTPPRYASTRRR